MTITIPANQPTRFDDACRVARTGDVIELQPGGVYETAGCWAFPDFVSLGSGVKLVATGATVRLTGPQRTAHGVERPDHDLAVLWCGPGVEIVGGTFDGDWKMQGGWFPSGIRFFGRFSISGARITGLSGSRQSVTPSGSVEAFAISSEGDTGGSVVEAVTVDGCRDDADSYVSGIYVGATVQTDDESVVTNCTVDLGEHGQFAYSSNQPTRFIGCTGMAARFFYNDTGPTRGTKIVNCSGSGSYAAFSLVAKPGATHRDVFVRGGRFDFPRAVEWWDQSGGQMTGGVVCQDVDFRCDFRAAVSAPRGVLAFAGCRFPESATLAVQGTSPQPLTV